MAILPGTYIEKRRVAADLTIEDVVILLPTEPKISEHDRADWLRQIEANEAPIGENVIRALRFAFPFDATVLRRLEDIRLGARLPEPRLCRHCACSELDECDPPCAWVAEDLCSACPQPAPSKDGGEPGVEALPAIDDEQPGAAPSPDLPAPAEAGDGTEEMAA